MKIFKCYCIHCVGLFFPHHRTQLRSPFGEGFELHRTTVIVREGRFECTYRYLPFDNIYIWGNEGISWRKTHKNATRKTQTRQ